MFCFTDEEEIDVGFRILPKIEKPCSVRTVEPTAEHKALPQFSDHNKITPSTRNLSGRSLLLSSNRNISPNGLQNGTPSLRPRQRCSNYQLSSSSESSRPTSPAKPTTVMNGIIKSPKIFPKKSPTARGRRRGKPAKNKGRPSEQQQEDTSPIQKRSMHNDLERQRRSGLRSLIQELKQHVPSIMNKERVANVHVLREATKLCTQLTHENKLYLALKMRNAQLTARVNYLKASMGKTTKMQ